MEIFLITLFLIVCLLLIFVVLLQKGRGGGLGAALGGAASSAFGTRTGDVFTWVTIVLTGLFLLLAIGTTLMVRPEKGRVPSPTFRPEAGPITSEVRVTIRVYGDKGNTKIYYTTDGSEPTEQSKPYRKVAVRIKPGMTLKAIAYRSGWDASPVKEVFYGRPEDYEVPATAPAWDPNALAPATGPVSDPNAAGPPPRPTTAPAPAATKPASAG